MVSYPNLDRAVFTVMRHGGGWAVEHDGRFLDASPDRDEVLASAIRHARASNDQGRPSRMKLHGDHDFIPER